MWETCNLSCMFTGTSERRGVGDDGASDALEVRELGPVSAPELLDYLRQPQQLMATFSTSSSTSCHRHHSERGSTSSRGLAAAT